MNYQIALDPELGVSADKFVADWNQEPRCQKIATAHLQAYSGKSFDPTLTDVINNVILPTAVNLGSSALFALILSILLKQGVRKKTRIIQEIRPDGTERLIVTIDEEAEP